MTDKPTAEEVVLTLFREMPHFPGKRTFRCALNSALAAAREAGMEEAALTALAVWDSGIAGAHGGEQANRTAAAIRTRIGRKA